jgi:hypothetical protein
MDEVITKVEDDHEYHHNPYTGRCLTCQECVDYFGNCFNENCARNFQVDPSLHGEEGRDNLA